MLDVVQIWDGSKWLWVSWHGSPYGAEAALGRLLGVGYRARIVRREFNDYPHYDGD